MQFEDFARATSGERRERAWGPAARAQLLLCSALCTALGACNLNNPGDEPPRGILYFPNAIALSKQSDGSAPRYLFVENSNFDLRYSHGTVQAYSLERLSKAVDRCRKVTACEIETKDILEDEMRITSFGTAIGMSSTGEYLFAATRTDSSLIYMHVNADADGDAVLTCKKNEQTCSLRGTRGPDAYGTGDDLAWPPDPEALIAGPLSTWQPETPVDGEFVLVAHTAGQVSLFVLDPTADPDQQLQMSSVLTGLVGALPGISFDPVTGFAYLPVASTGSPKVLVRVGVAIATTNGTVDIEHSRPYYAGGLQLDGVAPYRDTRDVAFIPAVPNAGTALAEDRALIVSEEPSALLVADINEARNPLGRAEVKATAVVGPQATRVVVGEFGGHPLAVVGSFGSREISVIDLSTMLARAVIPNLSGPFALALDESRNLLYVGDFRSSVIRVIDLAPLLDPESTETVGVIATLGKPRVLQELR